MSAAAYAKMVRRPWHLQLCKKHIRHIGVEVLAGMHDLLDNSMGNKFAGHHGCLDELWTGTYYG